MDRSQVTEYVCDSCKGRLSLLEKKKPLGRDQAVIAYDAMVCQECGRELITIDRVRIIGPFIAIVPLEPELKTKAGLIIPSRCWRFWCIGRVAKLSDRKRYECHKVNSLGKEVGTIRVFHQPEVEINDIVLIEKHAIHRVNLGSSVVFFIHYEDVALVLEAENSVLPM